jgi:hypothetical protein
MNSDELAQQPTSRLAGGRAASRALVAVVPVLGLVVAASAGAAASLRRYLAIADAAQLPMS